MLCSLSIKRSGGNILNYFPENQLTKLERLLQFKRVLMSCLGELRVRGGPPLPLATPPRPSLIVHTQYVHYTTLYPVYTIKQTSSKHPADAFKVHVHDVCSNCSIFAWWLLDWLKWGNSVTGVARIGELSVAGLELLSIPLCTRE